MGRSHLDSSKTWKTWSNLLFVIVGAIITFNFTIYGLAFIAMGLGSAYSHWTGKYLTDWAGMYVAYFARIGLFASLAISDPWWSGFAVYLSVVGGVAALFFHDVTYLGPKAKLAIGKKLGIRGLKWAYIIVLTAYLTSFGLSFFIAPWFICLLSGAIYLASLILRDAWDHGVWHIGIALAEITIFIPLFIAHASV